MTLYVISGAAKSKSSGSSAAAGAKAAAVSKKKKPKTTKAEEAEKVESNGSRFPFKSTYNLIFMCFMISLRLRLLIYTSISFCEQCSFRKLEIDCRSNLLQHNDLSRIICCQLLSS